MAKSESPSANVPDDLDDMVYVSDEEDTKKSGTNLSPGMIPEVKNLYPGEDESGRWTTTDKRPENLPEPEENDETARYALLIRNKLCNATNRSLSISSIVVQSPLLKKVLCWVLKDYPCMAPDLDRLEVVSPFRPFVHRWQRLTDALNNEPDPETKSHIQLFYDALKVELELTLEARDDFIAHDAISFNSLWTIFEPGTIVFTIINKRQVAARLKTTSIYQGKREDVFQLACESIYANGEQLGWGQNRLEIPEFGGMQKIYELPVYPLKYHRKVDKVTKQLIKNGKKYERLMGFHHKQYQGVALDDQQPYYVDSRIIIDAKTYMCHNPDRDMVLKPLNKGIEIESYTFGLIEECSEESDSSADEGDYTTDGDVKGNNKRAVPALTEEQLMLCGSAVKGYSLRNKRWLDFFVDTIHDIDWKEKAWDDVVLDEDQKDLIFSLTGGHCQNHRGLPTSGLNIFLSGPTGVGKTFAVESLAEQLRVPLFHVTPADVDLDCKDPDLESPFTDTLEMCGRWNAILLFDEAHKTLDSDDIDDNEGNYSLLLRALESHSTAFFVTCNAPAEDCMDDRLLSRFHLCLQLPELTTATREQIWQKCLESHKDIKFFDNFSILGHWALNGREIANAVIAAKTLVKGGNLEMKHLERVVPASKQIIPVVDDPWALPLRSKKKKGKRTIANDVVQPPPEVVDIVEEHPKTNEDVWADWGSSKPKKSKKKVDIDTEGQGDANVNPITEEPAKEDEPISDDWGFGRKKAKKSKESKDVEVNDAPIPRQDPIPNAEISPESPIEKDDFSWGTWGTKTKKKSKKTTDVTADVRPPTPPLPPPPMDPVDAPKDKTELDLGWGSFGVKEAQKIRRETFPEAKGSTVAKEVVKEEPVSDPAQPAAEAPAEVNEWDFWAMSKKSKKKEKKAYSADKPKVEEDVVNDELPVAEAAQPVTDTVAEDNANVKIGSCRTCATYEAVAKGEYCRRCGTLEGKRKTVCKSCAATKGYRDFATKTRRCDVCKELVQVKLL
ncbi:MAG: hypothetical protein Q9201_005593 [Fulgogasparrea decipioides]